MTDNKVTIVGVKAPKGFGKSTVASMISYIMRVGTTKANFDMWLFSSKLEDNYVVAFSDKLKDDLSNIINIPRRYFDDRVFKDDKYYLFDENRFVDKNKLPSKYHIYGNINFKDSSLASYLSGYKNKVAITLRTLMQYYGTEVVRNNLAYDVWIRIAINKANIIRNTYGFAIIADVRFDNEDAAIKQNCGKVIRIIKSNIEEDSPIHSSENISIKDDDYIIDNNGNLMGLFYKVLEFVKEYMI